MESSRESASELLHKALYALEAASDTDNHDSGANTLGRSQEASFQQSREHRGLTPATPVSQAHHMAMEPKTYSSPLRQIPAAAGVRSYPGQVMIHGGHGSRSAEQSTYLEQRRLFQSGNRYRPTTIGYVPNVAATDHSRKGKGSRNSKMLLPKNVNTGIVWKKDTVVLRKMNAIKVPDCEEIMRMGAIGLTSREIAFNIKGDAFYINLTLKETFPVLNSTGGYTLLRPAAGKANDLVMIKPPRGGFNTRYLKDIIKSTCMYVRPLQSDINSIKDNKVITAEYHSYMILALA